MENLDDRSFNSKFSCDFLHPTVNSQTDCTAQLDSQRTGAVKSTWNPAKRLRSRFLY